MFGKKAKAEKEKEKEIEAINKANADKDSKTWVCPKCKTENKKESLMCRMCGNFK
ncbi:MAG: hypothetical protein RR448_10370 [Niameybacter sp.]|uniref:hypothetical protein n=1 Tax=Niameybacter sp. TaxID=2033640 RepID=UPI002FC79E82